MREIKNVIFDWSGVISDDFDKIYLTYCELFRQFERPVMKKALFRSTFVLPYTVFCREHFADVPDEELQNAFRRNFDLIPAGTAPFDFVEAVLERLAAAGKTMIVVSSHSFVSREMKQYYPGKSFFARIYEDVKNKEHIIGDVMKDMGFVPEETVFVGDMTHDIDTGKKAGTHTAAVTSGYHSRERLAAADPDFLFRDIRGLCEMLC